MYRKSTDTLKLAGFSLIELLVVLAVISTIAAVAIPSYEQYTRKSRQENLKARILEIAASQERHFTAKGRYAPLMTELLPFGIKGKPGANGWLYENTTLYTGTIINDRTGHAFWVAGNTDVDRNADGLEDCWLFFSRNVAQPDGTSEGLLWLHDDINDQNVRTANGIDNNTVCKP